MISSTTSASLAENTHGLVNESRRDWIFERLLLYSPLVLDLLLGEHHERLSLCWALGIWIVQQILDACQDVLDGDRWPPTFILIEDAEAHGTRRVYVWMKKAGFELALGRLGWILFRKLHSQGKVASFPVSVRLPGDVAIPFHQISTPIRQSLRASKETKWLVLSPSLSFLCQAPSGYS